MWRRHKLIIASVLAATVLLAGSVGGVVFAQTGGTGTTTSGKTLAARVATILGVDQKKVEDAFTQAQKDIRTEALDTYLKTQVDQGKLTQEQAAQYKSWWQSRPDLPPGTGFRGHGFRGLRVPGQQKTS
ncbi:MAG: hypothetical protein Q8P00_04215 [Dehalococcoidia bacterium]|nr:hypothetical protein [Dehalococcoidia bacterium]